MNYNKINNLTGWSVFLIAFIVYFLTVSPTGSFWDCGEFIAVSNELEVPHPPGAPLYLLLGRLFAIFSFGNVEKVAFWINMLSVVASAFTALFTTWIVTYLGRKVVSQNGDNLSASQTIAIMFAGAVGGLTCTFADSIWFNAVEAEVYASSSFFTAIVVWLMFKWEARADEPDNQRWLILIAYVMGLSVGVHLLNLLAIPALAMIYYFRKYKFSWVGFGATMGASVFILWIFNSFVIKYTFSIALAFEKFFIGTYDLDTGATTGLGMPFGTGSLLFTALFLGLLIGGIWYSYKKNLIWLNTSIISMIMVYLGISSYAMLYIRSNADTPINENNPGNLLNFLQYMNREQYGDWPILYGTMYNAQPIAYADKERAPKYYRFLGEQKATDWDKNIEPQKLNTRYVIYQRIPEYEYRPGDKRFFPRMHNEEYYDGKGAFSYKNFVSNLGADPNDPSDDEPSGLDNIKFFFAYQLNHMYIRYFMWNFVGREGDEQHRVEGWESGLVPIKDYVPDYIKHDPSKAHYYGFPLILGLLGLAWQYSKNKKDTAVIGALFFFTGLAIILYLNQTPSQPRERDYSYAGSFQTFCIWVGLGTLALSELLSKALKGASPYVTGTISLALVPGIMGAANWKGHSRAGNYMAPDAAYNMLQSCEENAILFTNGDNDTFPLWYLQEVEGVRTDVRIVNLSLLNTDWYIHQLKMQSNKSAPLPITYQEKDYMGDKNGMVPYDESKTEILPVNKEEVLRNKVVLLEDSANIEAPMRWTIKGRGSKGNNYLRKQDILIIDILKNIAKEGWKRPFYFAVTIPTESYVGLLPYFQLEGMAYRVIPVRSQRTRGDERINRDKMYKLQTQVYRLRGLDDENVFYSSDIKRMIGNLRYNYLRLAADYVEGADTMETRINMNPKMPDDLKAKYQADAKEYRNRAKNLIDFITKRSPDKVVRIEPYYLTQYARVYAETGEQAKAKKLVIQALKNSIEDIKYDMATRYLVPTEDQTVRSLFTLFFLSKDEIKDKALTKQVADDYTKIQVEIMQYVSESDPGSIPQLARTAGYPWNELVTYYLGEGNDKAKAELLAKTWQQLTGDPYLMNRISGKMPQMDVETEEDVAPPQPQQAKPQPQQQPGLGNIPIGH